MKHLIVCREYPPAPYPPGGIGSYTKHISRLLAESGDVVHVIAQRWEGAPAAIAESHGGKLIVHRVSPDDQPIEGPHGTADSEQSSFIVNSLANSDCPSQAFSWRVAALAEQLVTSEGIDLIEAPE